MNCAKFSHGAGHNTKLVMYLQPQFNLKEQRFTDVELLVRFKRDNGEVLTPDRFLPMVRRSNIGQEFTNWTINQALEISAKLCSAGFKGKVAINMDGEQLNEQTLSYLQNRHSCQNTFKNIEIEVTEYLRTTPVNITANLLNQIQKLGISISIDDFGIGSNGLEALLNFPFDKLKADKSVMSADSVKREAIVKSLVGMTLAMNKSLVVEGVEDPDDVIDLEEWGVLNVQGFLYARPMPLTEFIGLLPAPGREKIV
ncbi:EAL domain-containing protein [Salinimonas sp. HHU 13199]|uniref:EAL domain-containing protein n=1 Tax=Salinimonas profundi TaxID=2729140 RepID=A0ABR8LQ79_9ALTE|nr:EAL domain-containing protein [Salinimonas profundi]MBD3587226.1 EAL domain-containing protein [Salinimonas profundi]